MEEGRGAAVHVSVVGQKQLYAITSSALPSNVKEKRREKPNDFTVLTS